MNAPIPQHADHHKINVEMRMVIPEKLSFWLPHLPMSKITAIVDFGCADGSLLKTISEMCPSLTARYYGIDNERRQRMAARENFPKGTYMSGTSMLAPVAGPKLLILSSVLHEVGTGMSPERLKAWWDFNVVKPGFEWIVIRDFASLRGDSDTPAEWLEKFSETENADLFERAGQFIRRYGYRHTLRNAMHWLLKYPYADNWERELAEDYYAVPSSQVQKLAINSGYYLVHHELTTSPFVRDRIKHDTDIDIGGKPTHYNMILRRNEPS